MPATPTPEVIAAHHAGFTDVYSRVDIYESDTTTIYQADANHIDGTVSVDSNRDERRTASVTLSNTDGRYKSQPNGFWYDKVFKLFRGIRYVDSAGDNQTYEIQLGEFYIDDIDSDNYPHTVSVSLRDSTKKLLQAKFKTSTEFASGVSIESVINAIAIAGGIPAGKISLPTTGVNTGKAFLFDRTTERWKAISEIATDYGYAVYFDNTGILTMTAFADPSNAAVSPSVFTFEAGGRDVSNPSFEDWTSTSAPSWWTPNYQVSGAGSVYSQELINVHSGSYAVKLTNASGVGSGFASRSIAVNPGDVFQVSMWSMALVTATAVPPANSQYLRVWFGNVEGFTSGQQIAATDILSNAAFTGEYAQTVGTVTVPAGASWMRVGGYAWDGVGAAYVAWFDDFNVKRLQPAADTKGNLVSFKRKVGSARIYNEVTVSGESTTTAPVYQTVQNTTATSPTRIAKLGIRSYFYTSSFITTTAQALAVATNFLQRVALEQFEIGIESLLTPWLEPGSIVTLLEPEALSTDPQRYLLADISIPLKPAAMSANLRRVTVVG